MKTVPLLKSLVMIQILTISGVIFEDTVKLEEPYTTLVHPRRS